MGRSPCHYSHPRAANHPPRRCRRPLKHPLNTGSCDEQFRVDESDSAAAAAEDTDGRHNDETLQRRWQPKLGSKASCTSLAARTLLAIS
mmetsp:Transcript_8376/g.23352  ORF Transcript_8376/g.23352 Transcript_8376/m.23352 type:complete len:89 (-) Transcript_8376:64-330(-)